MNNCIFSGRLTADPTIKYANSANGQMAIASFTLAVDRKIKTEGQTADFINVKAFGKTAEHVEKYWHKGMKMNLVSHCQTGSYLNKDNNKVYTTDFIADSIEFAESKAENAKVGATNDGFVNIPAGIENDLPFANPSIAKPVSSISESEVGELPFLPPR